MGKERQTQKRQAELREREQRRIHEEALAAKGKKVEPLPEITPENISEVKIAEGINEEEIKEEVQEVLSESVKQVSEEESKETSEGQDKGEVESVTYPTVKKKKKRKKKWDVSSADKENESLTDQVSD